MITIKKSKIEKLAERLAEEARKYNRNREKCQTGGNYMDAVKAYKRIEGMMAAADALGVKTSLIWNSAGDRIWMVKAGWQSVRIPQKGENDEA